MPVGTPDLAKVPWEMKKRSVSRGSSIPTDRQYVSGRLFVPEKKTRPPEDATFLPEVLPAQSGGQTQVCSAAQVLG